MHVLVVRFTVFFLCNHTKTEGNVLYCVKSYEDDRPTKHVITNFVSIPHPFIHSYLSWRDTYDTTRFFYK